MPHAAANAGLFRERFKRLSNRRAGLGIVASTTLASIAMIVNYLGSAARRWSPR